MSRAEARLTLKRAGTGLSSIREQSEEDKQGSNRLSASLRAWNTAHAAIKLLCICIGDFPRGIQRDHPLCTWGSWEVCEEVFTWCWLRDGQVVGGSCKPLPPCPPYPKVCPLSLPEWGGGRGGCWLGSQRPRSGFNWPVEQRVGQRDKHWM